MSTNGTPVADERGAPKRGAIPISMKEMAARYGASRKAVYKWKERGILPPPAFERGGTELWWPDEIDPILSTKEARSAAAAAARQTAGVS